MEFDRREFMSEKDGVRLERVVRGGRSFVLKSFEKEEYRREIGNYRILRSLGVPTIQVVEEYHDALLLEDLENSPAYRLAVAQDMEDEGTARAIAAWYRLLHGRGGEYVALHGGGMYDETDAITPENARLVAAKTDTQDLAAWRLLEESFDRLASILKGVDRTLTYNDFYYTNMAVAKDGGGALMFDYNLLGKGYAYADVRNVCSSLGQRAKDAFLEAYGEIDQREVALDGVAGTLYTLIAACQREVFPDWARGALEDLRRGEWERMLRALLEAGQAGS